MTTTTSTPSPDPHPRRSTKFRGQRPEAPPRSARSSSGTAAGHARRHTLLTQLWHAVDNGYDLRLIPEQPD